jgi:hypothetical protein
MLADRRLMQIGQVALVIRAAEFAHQVERIAQESAEIAK